MNFKKLKILLIPISTTLISLFICKNSQAQNIELKLGFGNFEAFNIGLTQTFKNWNVEYGYGNDFNIYNQGYYNAIHFGIGKPILIKSIPKNSVLSAQFKTFVWNIENQSNVFSAISLSTELLYKIKLNKNYQLGLYSGILWSSVFRYQRKQYVDIGFPKELQPNFGLTLYYNLK